MKDLQQENEPALSVEEHTPTPQEARGIYGFVFFLLLKILTISYFVWMFVAPSVFEMLPYAPPQQYWGLAVPVFICTGLFVFAFIIYPALHGLYDCNFYSLSSITDPDSHPEDYFQKAKAKAAAKSGTQQHSQGNESTSSVRSSPRNLKLVKKLNKEMLEKSKTLWEKERKFRDMQIRHIRPFPECDTKPIPPICDLQLDYVCKRLYWNEKQDLE